MLGKDFTTDICLSVCAVPASVRYTPICVCMCTWMCGCIGTHVCMYVEVRGQPQVLVPRQCQPFVRDRVSHWPEASPSRLG